MAAAHDSAPAVVVDGVSKSFRIPHERIFTLKERVLHPLKRTTHERFDALQGVTFAVERGEFFGIAGRNGSGKSTLLKCMAGIYRVDEGEIYLNGRVSTFIELGVGFNPDLAARDNVVVNGVMLGLTPKEALARYDEVIDFAELRQFEDLKLKNYSSGMQVRLAFSVMVQVNADVLLIDEVLAVGDVSFQQKRFDVFNRLRDERRTLLFVTHDMAAVRRFCDRALLLERGEIRMIGAPADVATSYVDLNFEGTASESVGRVRQGTGEAQLLDAWWEDDAGERQGALRQQRPCSFHVRARFLTEVSQVAIAVVFENEQHQPLMATSSEWAGNLDRVAAGEEVEFSVHFDMAFAPGRVFGSPWIAVGGYRVLDRRPRMCSIVVTGPHVTGGLVDLPHDVRVEARGGMLEGAGGG